MKLCRKIVIQVFILLLSLEGSVSAAKLTVIKVGLGDGVVEGGDIFCGSLCEEEYPEKTVVHLKATPEDDSSFVGWMLDGKPIEGVLTIDQKDLLLAARFDLIHVPEIPENFFWWYGDNNNKHVSTMVLDEFAVILDDREIATPEDLETTRERIRDVVQRYYPQAEITYDGTGPVFFVDLPEAVSREQLFSAFPAIKDIPGVQQASPVLYKYPEDRTVLRIPTGKISVKFPDSYSEERIMEIEAAYELVRMSDESDFFVYWGGDPLEAIELSKQLYESGQVKYSVPDLMEEVQLFYDISDDEKDSYFEDHWHLRETAQHGANVMDVWFMNKEQEFLRGSGVTIAIVEPGGVEIAHEDLTENVDEDLSLALGDPSPEEFPVTKIGLPPGGTEIKKLSDGAHGTLVAGIAAGRGFNGKGIIGAAPFATLVGYRGGMTPIRQKEVLREHQQTVDIYNNSWSKIGFLNSSEISKVENILQIGSTGDDKEKNAGRKGLGNIFVWAAGNGREKGGNANYYAYVNSRYAFTVAASRKDGIYASYSNPGANVLINAPSDGIPTTDQMGVEGYNPWGFDSHSVGRFKLTDQSLEDLQDEGLPEAVLSSLEALKDEVFYGENSFLEAVTNLIGQEQTARYQDRILYHAYRSLSSDEYDDRNYTKFGGGTSAAAPLAAGIIALMLQANPDLTWRDVQRILVETAYRNQYDDPDYSGWEKKGVYPFSHDYGFGRINAKAAVEAALSWTNVPEEKQEPVTGENTDKEPIPEDEDGIRKKIEITENITTEFVEIYFTSDHPRWCDLEITLTSPKPNETTSILSEQHSFCKEKGFLDPTYGYHKWRFGSIRHLGEPSRGNWFLTVKDKKAGKSGNFKECTLKIYGTELLSERSYVKKVTVSAGGDPIYSAGWMSLPSEEEEEEEEESSDEEETEQIVFLYYVEPQDPAAGAEAQIEIHSSEAMEDLSVRVAGEPDVDLDPCEASEDGTCWQGALTLPGTENSQLIIQGSDTAGQPLLPFADTTTKTLSEWAEEFDESGDTAHALGALPDPAWQLETPEESICSETERGVTCLFGGDDNGEGQGVVFLHPAEDGTELAAVLDEHDEAGASHSGVVWGSPSGLVLEIQPPRDDLELCEAHDDITTRCPHSWDYDPEEDAPPESEVHETELTWTLDATRQTEHCDLTVSWVVEGAEQAVTLAIEPASLCDAFVSEQKELPVTGSCAWTFEGGNYDWLKEELPPETSGPGASPVVSEYIDCQEYHSLRFGGSVSRGGCRENPLWETPPSWTYDVIEPGEPGFQREQTISVSYSGCQEWDDWLSKGDFRQTWPYDMVDLENGDEWVYQQKGRFPSSCLVEIVTVLWNPVGDCRYRYTPDSQSLEFPDGGIAVLLSGNQ